jgi:hypothetical protein
MQQSAVNVLCQNIKKVWHAVVCNYKNTSFLLFFNPTSRRSGWHACFVFGSEGVYESVGDGLLGCFFVVLLSPSKHMS